MKFFASLFLTALLAFAAGLFLSWWSVALASFLVALAIPQRPWNSFLSAFAGVFLLWGGLAWWIDQENQQILSHRIAELLPLNGSSTILMLITAFVGGLVGGMAGLSGGFLRGGKRGEVK
jgi:hypothetical protein